MTRPRDDLTYEVVAARLAYDPATGVITRKVAVLRGPPAGSRADRLRNKRGYRCVRLGSHTYPAQRVAWLLAHGSWPKGEVDHINRDPGDNSFANLRDVPKWVNGHNGGARRHSSTGIRGVQPATSGRWRASIIVQGRFYHLGTFDSPEEAAEAYAQARAKFIPQLEERV